MESNYKKLYVFFLVILALTPIGFRDYLLQFSTFDKLPLIVHVHAGLMTLWCLTLIAQPLLISSKRFYTHRLIGKMTYILVPLIVLSMWLMIEHSFIQMLNLIEEKQNLAQTFFPFSQMVFFVTFYCAAIIYSRKTVIHMRYIVLSSIVLLGPTIGRIDFDFIGLGDFNMDLIVMDLVIILLVIKDLVNKKMHAPYWLGLFSYLGLHAVHSYIPETTIWQNFASLLFN